MIDSLARRTLLTQLNHHKQIFFGDT